MTAEIRHQLNPKDNVWEGTHYVMRSRYGKYSIYRWDYVDFKRTSTTLAKGIDRELAVGMMKLLKESNENN